MTDDSMVRPPGGPVSPRRAGARLGPALLAAVLVVAGSAVTGLAAGLIWAAVAPRVQYQLYTMSPPTAYATNPETSAFIAADGWYCFIALAGGALIGLLGYLFAIRRYGALPMAGAVIGSIGAAFVAAWLGHRASGGPGFNHLLATSKPGTYLHAPISLGSPGALAFWPLAAAAVAGGFELVAVLRARNQAPYGGVPMPGSESPGGRPDPAQPPASGQSRSGDLQPPMAMQPPMAPEPPANGWPSGWPGYSTAPTQPGSNGRGTLGDPDARGGDQGRPTSGPGE